MPMMPQAQEVYSVSGNGGIKLAPWASNMDISPTR